MRSKSVFHLKFLIAFIAGLAVTVAPTSVAALQTYGGNNVAVSEDETIEDDVYISGGLIELGTDVEGDVNIAGGNITVSNRVSEDLQVAGGNITVNGNVGDDARISGGNIQINSEVSDDLLIAGGNVNLVGSDVSGELRAFAGSVQLGGSVSEGAYVSAGELVVTGTINGDLKFHGDRITIDESADIEGDVSYTKTANADIAEDAVAGSINKTDPPAWQQNMKDRADGLNAQWFGIKFAMSLVTALVLGLMFRNTVRRVIEEAFGEHRWQNLGIGFLGVVVAPIVSVILMVTVVGLPLGALTGIVFVADVFAAALLAPVALGTLLDTYVAARGDMRVTWLTILTGVVILQLLSLIPILGPLVGIVLVLFVLGGLWRVMGRAFF